MPEALPPSVYEAFVATARKHPENSFLCVPSRPGRDYAPDGQELSYGVVARIVDDLSSRYAAAGYGIGHRVGLLLEMRPDFFFHYLALNALGCGIVPVNRRGITLQKYKDGGLSDAKTFTLKQGLSWTDSSGRTKTETDLKEYRGDRAQAGRIVPRGFNKNNRFS